MRADVSKSLATFLIKTFPAGFPPTLHDSLIIVIIHSEIHKLFVCEDDTSHLGYDWNTLNDIIFGKSAYYKSINHFQPAATSCVYMEVPHETLLVYEQ